MMSDSESEFGSHNNTREKEFTNVFGIYFCSNCKNMLTPVKASGHILELSCPTCGVKNIDFSSRTDE